VTSLPCLRKDFIFDAYQVFESRAWGADAILLIVAALDDLQVTNLMSLAQGLGMDVLVEVHTQEEAERAVRLGAELIGVNNRSLADLSTDLRTGEAILPTLPDRFTVAESALESQDDLCRMLAAGAKAVLIGTAFCSAPDIKSKVAEVMGW
jgi:indole-3-glycerol phosphate synthase